jgi:gamma-glutamyltranspeptidase/glutathione hydrolase
MMAPSLLLDDGGLVRLVLGSGGSKRIRTALLQVVSNIVDFGMSVEEAVRAPRLHWDADCVQVEPGFDPVALRELERLWRINLWPVLDIYFGGVHAVAPSGEGYGDPRRGGYAEVMD